TYPRGLDTEAFFMAALERTDREATTVPAREHVTLFMYQHPKKYRLFSVKDRANNSDLRWTVDQPEDFEMVRRVYEGLDLGRRVAPYRETLDFVRAHPDIAALNAKIQQKAFS